MKKLKINPIEKIFYRIFYKRISKQIALYIRSRESSVEDLMYWRSNLKETDCKKSMYCWDRTLETIAREIESGKWYVGNKTL